MAVPGASEKVLAADKRGASADLCLLQEVHGYFDGAEDCYRGAVFGGGDEFPLGNGFDGLFVQSEA